VRLIPEKVRHCWENLISSVFDLADRKPVSAEKFELVQAFLPCSAIIFELIGPV
jgi:hypothetical protein